MTSASGEEKFSAYETIDDDTSSSLSSGSDDFEDPDFDILGDTQSGFAGLSIKRNPKIRCSNGKRVEVGIQEENWADIKEKDGVAEAVELNEVDKKSIETIQNLIQAGEVSKLQVDQCKVYLRKHGLRLTGRKDVLIQRIKEHLDIVNGGGEKKYPAASFVFNCKGDACKGDIVMFEQNVYEKFNIASRSANGAPCGTRTVAGRIVKESYGAAKQQHTFTIEVLWSKGEKPLPPLHPLLIKGRNLYKLKTMRQKWDDEGLRQKTLSEKHQRGSVARLNREGRIRERKMRTSNRQRKPEKRQQLATTSIPQEENLQGKYCKENTSPMAESWQDSSAVILNANKPQKKLQQRPPLMSMNNTTRSPQRYGSSNPFYSYQWINYGHPTYPVGAAIPLYHIVEYHPVGCGLQYNHHTQGGRNVAGNQQKSHKQPFHQGFTHKPKQPCRFHARGTCNRGTSCKFLHGQK